MTVLTIGTFDILHYGHIAFLKRCKLLANPYLVVGVNSDRFAASFKDHPPVMSERERCRALSQLGYEAVLNKSAGRKLIRDIRPDILAVSSDWARKDYPLQIGMTQDELDKLGVIVAYIPYTHEISTSMIVGRIEDREMMLLYCYDKAYPAAVQSVLESGAERFAILRTGDHPLNYGRAVKRYWGQDDLFTVEQDIILPPDAVKDMEDCPAEWCTFPYAPAPHYLNCHSITCMRFRKGVMKDAPWTRDDVPWREVDDYSRRLILSTGLDHPHVHYPPAVHLHEGIDLPRDEDLEDLWEQLWDGRRPCRGYVEYVGDRHDDSTGN